MVTSPRVTANNEHMHSGSGPNGAFQSAENGLAVLLAQIVRAVCESRGGRPGLPVLNSLYVVVFIAVKQH